MVKSENRHITLRITTPVPIRFVILSECSSNVVSSCLTLILNGRNLLFYGFLPLSHTRAHTSMNLFSCLFIISIPAVNRSYFTACPVAFSNVGLLHLGYMVTEHFPNQFDQSECGENVDWDNLLSSPLGCIFRVSAHKNKAVVKSGHLKMRVHSLLWRLLSVELS